MRGSITTLAAVGVAVLALAGPAAADDPNARHSQSGTAGASYGWACTTPPKPGVFGRSGAQGFYVDGCTTRTVTCQGAPGPGGDPSRCRAHMETTFSGPGSVTQNARMRMYDAAGNAMGFRDKSCAGVGSCRIIDDVILARGQRATVQCNGVRWSTASANAVNACTMTMRRP